MQQRARAEEEKRKRQEAESLLRGYRPNTFIPYTPSSPERSEKKSSTEYVSQRVGQLDDFTMKQRALAEEERRRKQEAESYLRNYQYKGPTNKSPTGSPVQHLSPSPSWDTEKSQKSVSSVSQKFGLVASRLSQFTKKKPSSTYLDKEHKDELEYLVPPVNNSQKESVKENEESSPVSVRVGHFPSSEESKFHNNVEDRKQKLHLELEKGKKKKFTLLKTRQKVFKEKESKITSLDPSPLKTSNKSNKINSSWDLYVHFEFEPNEKAQENSKKDRISEVWRIHQLYTVHFSSKRMNEVALKSGNIRNTFERKFGEAGITLLETILQNCGDQNLDYDVLTFSSRATNANGEFLKESGCFL